MPAVSEAPARSRRRQETRPGGGPAGALVQRAVRDGRVLSVIFAYLFLVYSFIQPVSYRRIFKTATSRAAFARGFGTNPGLRILYGEPHNVATVSGYTAWRVGGILAIAAAVYGLLASVQALRGEEDAGRMELALAGIVSRRMAYLSAMAAIGATTVILWAAEFAGFAFGGLALGGSAYLALATVSVVPVIAGLGAVASQLAGTRRFALEIAGGALTLVDPRYFEEIIGTLRADVFEVHHFALLAEPATVVRRLRARSLGLEPRRQPWEVSHLAGWLRVLERPEFALQVRTDHKTVADVADLVAGSAGLTIMPSAGGPVRAWLHRYATTARSIHWN